MRLKMCGQTLGLDDIRELLGVGSGDWLFSTEKTGPNGSQIEALTLYESIGKIMCMLDRLGTKVGA
jgi:hypothetical protein